MSDKSPLQIELADAVARAEHSRDYYDGLLRKILETSGKPLWDIERGKTKRPGPKALRAIEQVLGYEPDYLVDLVHPRDPVPRTPTDRQPKGKPDDITMVGIQNIDQAWGLGAAFTDSPVEIEVLHFPKIWVDSITSTSPALLTWARCRGDSMEPTIGDGDLVLLDRSLRKVTEQDAMWAYTIGDVASIKRLRVKGDRYQILSDNPAVPDDEEPIDFVNVVARVIFVGAKK